MKELMLIMAKVMPREALVKQVKEAIEKYELDPSEHNFNGIEAMAMLLCSKRMTEGDIFETLKGMDRIEKAAELYDKPKVQ